MKARVGPTLGDAAFQVRALGVEGAHLPGAGVQQPSSMAFSLCGLGPVTPSSLSFPGYEMRMGEGSSVPDSQGDSLRRSARDAPIPSPRPAGRAGHVGTARY